MHLSPASREAHGNIGFLPWHRAYLLDLERELQAIDPSVALPYWRFDQPAPNVFTRQFMGVPDSAGRVQFTAGHPFGTWRTDGQLGILEATPSANAAPAVRNETQTIALGGAAPNAAYGDVRRDGGRPARLRAHELHSRASSSRSTRRPAIRSSSCCTPTSTGSGPSGSGSTGGRTRPRRGRSRPRCRTESGIGSPTRCGRGTASPARPGRRPRRAGTLAASPSTTAPGARPRVRAMIDYQAVAAARRWGSHTTTCRSRCRRRGHRAIPETTSRPSSESGAGEPASARKARNRRANRRARCTRGRAHDRPLPRRSHRSGRGPALVAARSQGASGRARGGAAGARARSTSSGRASSLPRRLQAGAPRARDRPARHAPRKGARAARDRQGPLRPGTARQGLQNPEEALVSEAKAIQFLGYDDHAELVPLARQVYQRSTGAAREEALRALATDPQSEKLLTRLLKDKSERSSIRRISASGLQSLNPGGVREGGAPDRDRRRRLRRDPRHQPRRPRARPRGGREARRPEVRRGGAEAAEQRPSAHRRCARRSGASCGRRRHDRRGEADSLAMLPEQSPIYAGRGTNEAERLRGYVLSGFETAGLAAGGRALRARGARDRPQPVDGRRGRPGVAGRSGGSRRGARAARRRDRATTGRR